MNSYRIAESRELLARWLSSKCASRHPLYTGYLQSLAAGERLDAVHKYLRPLIAELASADHGVRLELVDTLCRSLDFRGRVAGSSPVPGLPYELLEQVAIPTLIEQRRAHPDDAYAHLWLAMLPSRYAIPGLPSSRELIKLACQLSPDDEFITERAADALLHSVWYACHHLPDGLLAPAATVSSEIEELRQVASRLREERRKSCLEEAALYAKQLEEYERSQENPAS